MAILSGKAGTVTINKGQYQAVIKGVTSWELDYQGDAVETTGMSDGGKRTYIGGLTGWSGSVEFNVDSAATLPTPAAAVTFVLRDSGDAGANTYSGTAITTSVKVSTSVDSVVKCTVAFQGTGTLSIA